MLAEALAASAAHPSRPTQQPEEQQQTSQQQTSQQRAPKEGGAAGGEACGHRGHSFLTGADRSCGLPLSKYELTRALGARASQLARGARPRVATPPHMLDPLDIARAELDAGQLELQLQRVLPDGVAERWSVQELRERWKGKEA